MVHCCAMCVIGGVWHSVWPEHTQKRRMTTNHSRQIRYSNHLFTPNKNATLVNSSGEGDAGLTSLQGNCSWNDKSDVIPWFWPRDDPPRSFCPGGRDRRDRPLHNCSAARVAKSNGFFFYLYWGPSNSLCFLCLKETTTMKKSHLAGNRHENPAFQWQSVFVSPPCSGWSVWLAWREIQTWVQRARGRWTMMPLEKD